MSSTATSLTAAVVGTASVAAAAAYLAYRFKFPAKNAGDGSYINEVLFFPDESVDNTASREDRVMIYRSLLETSRPLKILCRHLSRAEESIDLCLFLITREEEK